MVPRFRIPSVRRSLTSAKRQRRLLLAGAVVLLLFVSLSFLAVVGDSFQWNLQLSLQPPLPHSKYFVDNKNADVDALDIFPPREGERLLTFDEYLACLAKRLNVDHRTKAEHPFTNVNETIPYLVMPVTVEQGDMKALMCNIDVPIRHLMYVQNGGVGSMTRFLDRVQEAFAFTPRLKIVRMPRNYGYSVALNVAMRDALSLPFDDVPFFLMGNNDVRFPAGLLTKGLPLMYERSLPGRAKIAELEAEVATEPNAHTPAQFREVPLRSTDGRHVLVTSRLLPDRIRYQPKAERRKAFADYYGALYPDEKDQTAFWGLTRLAMEVTGFFDENCYPAYFEDTDYVRRMTFLGFQASSSSVLAPGLLHLGNGATLAAARKLHAQTSTGDALPFIRAASVLIKEMYYLKYASVKYGTPTNIVLNVEKEPYPNEELPLDVYVLNARKQRAIAEMLKGGVAFFTLHPEGRAIYERFDPVQFVPEERRNAIERELTARFQMLDAYKDAQVLRTVDSAVEDM